jgi:hypothetical protein
VDMGLFITIIKRLVQAIRLFFEIVGIIQIVLWLIGGGVVTGGILALLQEVPIIVPITLVIIGTGAFVYATIRTVYRYRVWNNLKNIPELDDVLRKAWDIHIHLRGLHDVVVKQNRRKNIKTKLRQALAKRYLEIVGISLNDLANGINPDGTIKKKLWRKMKRIFGLREGNYFAALKLLKDYARLLNKSKLGLKDAIETDSQYDQLRDEFMKSQLNLNIPNEAINVINNLNNLPDLSYGLYSLSIGMNLVHEGRTWYKDVPDGFIRQTDDVESTIGTAYVRATMWAKNKVKLAMFKEAVK